MCGKVRRHPGRQHACAVHNAMREPAGAGLGENLDGTVGDQVPTLDVGWHQGVSRNSGCDPATRTGRRVGTGA